VIDYLMKPVSQERFTKAAFKALDAWQKLQPAPRTVPAAAETVPDYFFVNVEYSLMKINFDEITHVEGMKDYVKIFLSTAKKPVLTKLTLKGLEEKLPIGSFMRVHRSFIVNLRQIGSIRNHQISIGDHEIPVSESNMEELLKVLGYSK
jgi:DNA-binding LytR/AlgR family response regulator